ncbi:MAG: hypothetical protein EOP45_22025 [Sphingobacteriaceae bacterium]|nr:MAG: hypothetical protein EOP45_22025 [Sphingobacteriaceae bacterium]
MHSISAKKAIDLLNEGRALTNLYISGELKIEADENWEKEMVFENCIIEYFSAIGQQFIKPVKIANCYFKNCSFTFVYFLSGLTIDSCTFESYLDFQAGGHNKTGNIIAITNNDFKKFVNFFGCCYENEVIELLFPKNQVFA